MKVLVACESSGVVREAFIKRGHNAWSCDLLPTKLPGNHIQGDVLEVLKNGWDLMIAHPPCTYLAVSGAVWFDSPRYPNRRADQKKAIDFFMRLATAPINKICIENPVCIMSTIWRKPNQIIQPYFFGDEAKKTTCLWLKNLPPLRYGQEVQMALGEMKPPQTDIVDEGEYFYFKSGARRMPKWLADALSLSKEKRQELRSKTFLGIADAMAEQWGNIPEGGY
ncbi:hypothetical protein ES704_01985 [subsurface metagenome]|jgi:hypothetical protein